MDGVTPVTLPLPNIAFVIFLRTPNAAKILSITKLKFNLQSYY
jgi:hypothetical protein